MKRALCIGINYANSEMELYGAVNDAQDWATLLVERGVQVQNVLLEKEATRANILKGLTELLQATGPNELAIITFAGHGTWVPDLDGDEIDGRDEAWCPYDLDNELILDDELYLLFDQNRKPEARVALIADSCHSGTVMRSAPKKKPGKRVKKRFLPPYDLPQFKGLQKSIDTALKQEHMPLAWMTQGVVCMSACSDKEFAFDTEFDGRPKGAFSYYLQQLIPKLPPQATYRDLFRLVRNHLPSDECPQTPVLSGPKYAQLWEVFSNG
jgi:hypothetical protein